MEAGERTGIHGQAGRWMRDRGVALEVWRPSPSRMAGAQNTSRWGPGAGQRSGTIIGCFGWPALLPLQRCLGAGPCNADVRRGRGTAIRGYPF